MDPLAQLSEWLDDPTGWEAGAMVLATADASGRVNARYVLLRGIGPDGLRFFTNHESEKARELTSNPYAAVVFGWPEQYRQARVRGRVSRLSDSDSDAYFAARPRGSQLGAWASPQSRPVSREELDAALAAHEARFAGGEVPRPAHWGGYLLVPEEIEFWYGRPNRLHDRHLWVRNSDGWSCTQLAP